MIPEAYRCLSADCPRRWTVSDSVCGGRGYCREHSGLKQGPLKSLSVAWIRKRIERKRLADVEAELAKA